MAQNLTEFLMEHPVDGIEEEVVISKRLKGYKFKIRPYTTEEHEAYIKKSRKISKKGKVDFNDSEFARAVVIDCTIYPNFADAELIKSAGCKTPYEFLGKVLMPGEIQTLANKISELSGFTDDMEALIDEVKN